MRQILYKMRDKKGLVKLALLLNFLNFEGDFNV